LEAGKVPQSSELSALWLRFKDGLGNARLLVVAPDRPWDPFPFAAWPIEAGKFLIQDYELSYVPSGKEILRWGNTQKPRHKPVILCDPQFDLTVTQGESSSSGIPGWRDYRLDRAMSSPRFRPSHTFSSLTHTRAQGRYLADLLGNNCDLWMQDRVLEKRFQELQGPAMIHLATRIFFPGEFVLAQRPLGREVSPHVPYKGLAHPVYPQDPFSLAGLALSGVNTFLQKREPPPDAEDGILTAHELAMMDLQGTDIVTLDCPCGPRSAVLQYLSRSLLCAGAKTVVWERWDAQRAEAMELLWDFYQRIFQGQAKASALREAQLNMLRSLRDQGKPPAPWLWSAWVVTGDPGTISFSVLQKARSASPVAAFNPLLCPNMECRTPTRPHVTQCPECGTSWLIPCPCNKREMLFYLQDACDKCPECYPVPRQRKETYAAYLTIQARLEKGYRQALACLDSVPRLQDDPVVAAKTKEIIALQKEVDQEKAWNFLYDFPKSFAILEQKQPERVPEVLSRLVKMLGYGELDDSMDRKIRQRAIRAARAVGKGVIPYLLSHYSANPWYFAANIVLVAGEISPENEDVRRLLAQASQADDPRVRLRVPMSLEKHRADWVVPFLKPLAKDSVRTVRKCARKAIREQEAREAPWVFALQFLFVLFCLAGLGWFGAHLWDRTEDFSSSSLLGWQWPGPLVLPWNLWVLPWAGCSIFCGLLVWLFRLAHSTKKWALGLHALTIGCGCVAWVLLLDRILLAPLLDMAQGWSSFSRFIFWGILTMGIPFVYVFLFRMFFSLPSFFDKISDHLHVLIFYVWVIGYFFLPAHKPLFLCIVLVLYALFYKKLRRQIKAGDHAVILDFTGGCFVLLGIVTVYFAFPFVERTLGFWSAVGLWFTGVFPYVVSTYALDPMEIETHAWRRCLQRVYEQTWAKRTVFYLALPGLLLLFLAIVYLMATK
jgi:hypothetical protein